MKKIVKNFNNFIKSTIFKVKNKTNDKFHVSNFNKYIIAAIVVLFIYIFYLLIPLLYDKKWIQNKIVTKLSNEFNINLSNSFDISYRILPKPHYLIKDTKTTLAEIKDLNVYISQNNFFNRENIRISGVVIEEANFFLLNDNFKTLYKNSENKFSKKKIEINNSNIFLKNNAGETISIIKIFKSFLFFDDKKLLNMFNLSGEVFNIPFKINSQTQIEHQKNNKINIEAKNLRLNIFNESNISGQDSISGKNIISLLESTINTKYELKKKLIVFSSINSRINNSKVAYNGEFSINPFDLDLDIDLGEHKISQLFNINPVFSDFIKSGLLFNDNISLTTTIAANSGLKEEIFQHAKINFHIVNGKIDLDNTIFINDKIGFLELKNSNLFFKNKNLILNTDILIDIKSSNHLFSFLNTNKSSRKDFKKILINLNYNFLSNQFEFNSAKIDNNEFSDQLLTIIEGFEDNNLNNIIKSRGIINKLLKAYAG